MKTKDTGSIMRSHTLISLSNFSLYPAIGSWQVVTDQVMGGASSASYEVNNLNEGVFSGTISTKNDGGFALIRHRFNKQNIEKDAVLSIRVKGFTGRYKVRIKANFEDYFAYIAEFNSTDQWETINIKLSDFQASYRGRKLDRSNFNDSYIEEIAFMVSNGKEQSFNLSIDKIVIN